MSFHCNVAQLTFGIRFVRQVIFNNYVNKFGTYLFIPQRVLHCLLRSKKEKFCYITRILSESVHASVVYSDFKFN